MPPTFFQKTKEIFRREPTTEIRRETETGKRESAAETKTLVEDRTQKQDELKRRIQSQAIPRPAIQPAKTLLRRELEVILAEDVLDLIKQAPPAQQQKIRECGRETLNQIEIMISHAKIKINALIRIILEWLKLLPISNKYFIEQEAKIKAERILLLAEEQNKKES